ncbi:sensor histidine kinase [Vibrio coralliilyticus]|uniref:sensor histidine kinase n=1 Tax=Vibrio coralliilyticus TaxID=190893 RepID=UPI00148CC681|nr:HAMP domain-containing sensor histidine kinase [Vibrio coralliilyticus]NOI27127.1 HAMP domain-containing histidine kinase [Vibrio coralliilyticus]NOI46582.1 HAMP domain-containing histidine kinase [Vibrio coralliilyticus]
MFLTDPFKKFISFYGVLVMAGILIILFAKNELSNWVLDVGAYPLLESEARMVEDLWYDDGQSVVLKELVRQESNPLFYYQLGPIVSNEQLSNTLGEELIPEGWDVAKGEASLLDDLGMLPDHEDADALSLSDVRFSITFSGLDDAEAERKMIELLQSDPEIEQPELAHPINNDTTIMLLLPNRSQWQVMYISLNLDYFDSFTNTINLLLMSIGAVLIVGYLITMLMLRNIKARLTDINTTSHKIQQTNSLSQRIEINQLSGPLAETSQQINLMLDSIEEQVNTTREQANNIAHDLRTPITAVYNKVQRLAAENPQLIDLEITLGKLVHTFNTLLRINRLERGSETLDLQTNHLSTVINSVHELYEPVMEEKQLNLTLNLVPDLQVMANDELLFQVLCNLIDNAAKFSPIGGAIEINTYADNDHILLTIADQGGGVEAQSLTKLGQKFFRQEASRSTEGNGLGLSFVTSAIEKMSGEVRFSNATLNHQRGLRVEVKLKKS